MDHWQHIWAAFHLLGDRVRIALQTQLGDAARLNVHWNGVPSSPYNIPAGMFPLSN